VRIDQFAGRAERGADLGQRGRLVRRPGVEIGGEPFADPLREIEARNSAIIAAVALPSRPVSSNTSRSKFEETCTSIDGDTVGATASSAMRPVATVRAMMSLRFVATTMRATGRPMRLAP
jgi:hypothetical protein